jgi:molecular chaperone HscC
VIIGIDLGTTHSAVSYLTDDGPALIPNALGESLTPSVVAIDESGHVLVGQEAKEYQVLHPERAVSLFKRHMGTDWTCKLDKDEYTPEQLSSLVLKNLKEDAEAFLNRRIERAVITVPAYFNDSQRKATIRAGQMADLKVERIINEPTAAAIAYGLHDAEEDKVVVVFDLGGGTFDVSVVELYEGTVEVRASAGESILGGEDFTNTLAARALESTGRMFEQTEAKHPMLVARLIQQCERAKRQLSQAESVEIKIPNEDGEIQDDAATVTVTRDQFDAWTEMLLGRIELPIRRGLGDADLQRSDVNEVILVGGATRMPAIKKKVKEIFHLDPRSRLNPDEVVALGAAVQAGLIEEQVSLEDLVVTDVSPFTLGIELSKQFGSELRGGYYLPVINRNTTIPISRVEHVATTKPNQEEVTVRVFQGEGRRVVDNTFLGEFEVEGIPKGPAGQQVDIRFSYDLNGVLEVEATVVETQVKSTLVITKYARGLSEEEIAESIQRMNELKRHPREESANRFIMKRAERVYKELPMMQREHLAELVDGFEGALELQERDLIDRHRDALEHFLDMYEDSFFDEQEDDDEDSTW